MSMSTRISVCKYEIESVSFDMTTHTSKKLSTLSFWIEVYALNFFFSLVAFLMFVKQLQALCMCWITFTRVLPILCIGVSRGNHTHTQSLSFVLTNTHIYESAVAVPTPSTWRTNNYWFFRWKLNWRAYERCFRL